MPAMIPASLRSCYDAGGQGQVFRFADSGKLSLSACAALVSQLERIDVPLVNALFSATMGAAAGGSPSGALTPCNDVTSLSSASVLQVTAWRHAGLCAIAQGQAAALILAGGQGTRLGFDRPKGEYQLGLASGMSLFELQAGRIQRLRVLAAGAAASAALPSLPLYIMTSPMTDADTRAYWESKAYFGLPRGDVVFFSQGTLPCLSMGEGKMLLESGGAVAEAPDGNGGIYRALHLQGVVADMQRRGVRGIHAFAVDNAIVRPADPVFLGFCMGMKADVGAKVCPKAGPHEKVGVLCRVGGRYAVVEYSDMDRQTAELTTETGALVYNTGNLCMHFYSIDFLAGPCSPEQLPKVYHLAKKSIAVADEATGATMGKDAMAAVYKGANNGIKLESFIFDVFPAAETMAVMEIDRAAEFSPVKNAPGSSEDSPDTARALLSNLHRGWIQAAGGLVEGEGLVEVSPTASYAGEGMEQLQGLRLVAPCLVLGKGEASPALPLAGVSVHSLS